MTTNERLYYQEQLSDKPIEAVKVRHPDGAYSNWLKFTDEARHFLREIINRAQITGLTRWEVPAMRVIYVRFIGPTNYRGSRIVIETEQYDSAKGEYFTERKYFSYKYNGGDVGDQAYNILIANGWNITGRASECNRYMFFANNWGDDFLRVKDLQDISELQNNSK